MFRKVLLAAAIIATPALTSCTGSTTPQQTEITTPAASNATTAEATVTLGSNQWTCEDIVETTSSECNKLMQRVFDDYNWNLNRYLTEGDLTKLKDQEGVTSKEVAYVGLIACATMTGLPNYEDYFLAFEHDERFKEATSLKPALTEAWSAAEKLLCFTEDEATP